MRFQMKLCVALALLLCAVCHSSAYNVYRVAGTAAGAATIKIPAKPGAHYAAGTWNTLGIRFQDVTDAAGNNPAQAGNKVAAKDGGGAYQGMSTSERPCQLFHNFRPAAFGGAGNQNVWSFDTANLGANLAAAKDGGANHFAKPPAGHVTIHTNRAGGAADMEQLNDDIVDDTDTNPAGGAGNRWAVAAPANPRDNDCVQNQDIFIVAPATGGGAINVPQLPAGAGGKITPHTAAGAYQGYSIARVTPCNFANHVLPAAFNGLAAAGNFVWHLAPGALPAAPLASYFEPAQNRGHLHLMPVAGKTPAQFQAAVNGLGWAKVAAPVLPRDAACVPPPPLVRRNSV